jgi:hypothetical protein
MLPWINAELNTNLVDKAAFQTNAPAEQVFLLGEILANGELALIFPPEDGCDLMTYRLLIKQNITALLYRLLDSDGFIRASVPVLARYRKEAKAYELPAKREHIKAVLGSETKTMTSFGMKEGGPADYLVVETLLEALQSGDVRSYLSFTDLDGTKFDATKEKEK